MWSFGSVVKAEEKAKLETEIKAMC